MYKKRENEEFKLLVLETAFLTENGSELGFSKGFPPELAGIIGSFGTSVVGVTAIYTSFSGLSGAGIMSALASFGIGGAVGGLLSFVSIVALPTALVGGGVYTIVNQNKLKSELFILIEKSYEFEKQLSNDERENAIGILKALIEYRNNLIKIHKL